MTRAEHPPQMCPAYVPPPSQGIDAALVGTMCMFLGTSGVGHCAAGYLCCLFCCQGSVSWGQPGSRPRSPWSWGTGSQAHTHSTHACSLYACSMLTGPRQPGRLLCFLGKDPSSESNLEKQAQGLERVQQAPGDSRHMQGPVHRVCVWTRLCSPHVPFPFHTPLLACLSCVLPLTSAANSFSGFRDTWPQTPGQNCHRPTTTLRVPISLSFVSAYGRGEHLTTTAPEKQLPPHHLGESTSDGTQP